jgi:hypothetical protein
MPALTQMVMVVVLVIPRPGLELTSHQPKLHVLFELVEISCQ